MVTALFKEGQKAATTTSLQKYDYGEVLRIKGLSLPRYVAVQFAVDGMSEALPSSIGETVEDVTDVLIPNSLLRSNIKPWNYNIMAYVYIVSGNSGKTEYTITIPVKWRPKTGDDQAADDDVAAVIGTAVEKMNTATQKAEAAANQAAETAAEISVDREQIQTNATDISSLKGDLVDLCKIDNVEFNTTSEALKYIEDDYEFSNFNLALEDKLLNGYSISGQGKRVENATWSIYDYKIYVGSNSKVYTNQTTSGQNGNITLSFYDENNTFISRTMLDLHLSPKVTDIPTNAHYFVAARTNSTNPTTIISFEKTDWSTKFVKVEIIHKLSKYVSRVSEDISSIHKISGKKLRICVLGDLHSGQEGGGNYNGSWISDSSITGMTADERMQYMVDTIMKLHKENPFDLILCTGDVAIEKNNHSSDDFNNPIRLKEFCDKFKSQLPIPFMSCVGNHDPFTNDDWLKYMGTPRQYSFETDDYYFIMLDTYSNITPALSGGIYGLSRTPIDMDFVNSEITKAGDKKIIICGHYFTSDDTSLKEVCRNNDNIIAVITGHSHVYSIAKGTSDSWGENTTYYMTNNFCYPETKWDGLPTSHTMWLWSVGIIEIADNTLRQKEVYPPHNYVGVNCDFKGLETEWYIIENVDKKEHADYYIDTYNVINNDLFREINELKKRVEVLEP